ncbi:MAG: alpha/beta hydrolase-fold protein [Pseudonocardia sediminis]
MNTPVTTPTFLVMLAVASLLVLAGVLVLRRGRGRLVVVLVAVPLLVINAAAGTNAYYDYFRTLGAVVGAEPADEVALARLLRRTDRPDQGVFAPVTIPAGRTGFAARQALVWVPPAWFARPRPPLPVIVLLHGTPGSPQDWTDGGRADETADAYAAAHGGRAPILVMPDINGTLDADTECVDGPAGRVETYLTVDLPEFVRSTFRTERPGPGWAVAGLSEGGSCAAMLALRHPGAFATFGDYSGLTGPRLGETNDDTASTVSGLFGGSAQEFAAHEPADLLASRRYPGTGGWFEVGSADAEPFAATRALVPPARRAGIDTCEVVVPGGGHTFDVFSQAFSDSLPWMAARLGLGPGTDLRCPAG